MVLFEAGREVSAWPSGYPMFAGDFEARAADLDADGVEEFLVTDHIGTSNGIAITFHRAIIVGRDVSGGRSAISFELQEFCGECESGTYVLDLATGRIRVLVTEWMWRVSSIDPNRPPGNYVVGRWFTYERGRLRPQGGTVARRYVSSFSDVRGSGKNTPASWFTGVYAKPLRHDPAVGTGQMIRSFPGVLDRHERTRDGTRYTVRLQSGQHVDLIAGLAVTVPDPTGAEPLDGVGVGDAILPRGMSPDVVIGDVAGRRVRVEEYQDGKAIRRVLRILDAPR